MVSFQKKLKRGTARIDRGKSNKTLFEEMQIKTETGQACPPSIRNKRLKRSPKEICQMSRWFRGLRLKFLVPLFFLVVVVALIGGTSVVFMKKLTSSIQESSQQKFPQAQAVAEMGSKIHQIVRYMWGIYGAGLDLEDRKRLAEQVQQALTDFETTRTRFESYQLSEASKEIYKSVPDQWKLLKSEVEATMNYFAKNEPRWDEMGKYNMVAKVRTEARPLTNSFQKLADQVQKEQAQYSEDSLNAANFSIQMIVLISLIAFFVSVFMTWKMANSVTQRITSFVSGIGNASETVHHATDGLQEASHVLSDSSIGAAASLEQTVASLSLIMETVKTNEERLKAASDLSNQAGKAASHGEDEVMALVQAMSEISDSSRKISEITAVIDDIAFQTNLLALNAAVEAARAGEQGKGFAVVAEAVRSLAQRSAIAAKDISSLIKETGERVERGAAVAGKSGEALKNIVDVVKKVTVLNSEISESTQQQSSGIVQINQAMTQLDDATQKNAQLAQSVAESSEKMRVQADGIRLEIAGFSQAVEGVSPTKKVA
jgi:methyl-accepting chemotaxis protein